MGTKKPGRPTLYKDKKPMNIKLTDEARQILVSRAAAKHMSPSDFINTIILQL